MESRSPLPLLSLAGGGGTPAQSVADRKRLVLWQGPEHELPPRCLSLLRRDTAVARALTSTGCFLCYGPAHSMNWKRPSHSNISIKSSLTGRSLPARKSCITLRVTTRHARIRDVTQSAVPPA